MIALYNRGVGGVNDIINWSAENKCSKKYTIQQEVTVIYKQQHKRMRELHYRPWLCACACEEWEALSASEVSF